MKQKILFDNISIVLHKPRFPENIGSTARAMCNMGIKNLIIVKPENPRDDRIRMMATHAAADVVDNMKTFDNLNDALAPFQYIAGFTARYGRQRQSMVTPGELARNLVPISQQNSIALLFGPEDKGLSNEDLKPCHCFVKIPTADFSSLNLSQAVMVMAYEIFKASGEKHDKFIPRMASSFELGGMYDQLREILVKISYINADNPDYWMNNFRRFFAKLSLSAKEVRMLRGVFRQVNWYGDKRYEQGRTDAETKKCQTLS